MPNSPDGWTEEVVDPGVVVVEEGYKEGVGAQMDFCASWIRRK